MTLVELVVVLTILVLLAGTAITATEGLVEQSRYDATERTLTSIEDAVLGSYNAQGPAERTIIAGFVADVGRLPRAGVTPETALAELWIRPDAPPPAGIVEFALQPPVGDPGPVGNPALRLPGGWRGPYVRLGLGGTTLLDGWSRPIVALRADGTPASPGDPIAGFLSFGADGLEGGTDYAQDLTVSIERTVAPVQAARHRGAISVRVESNVSSGFVVVRVYGPIDGDVRTLLDSATLVPAQHVFSAGATEMSVTFENLPVGPRVVRAYASATEPRNADAEIDSPTARSKPVQVALVQGGVATVEIELVLP
jgi:type II secretory pathway pseudopilin PulG